MNRVLVIDDEPALGENIQRMLRAPDTAVAVLTDPVKGLKECLDNPPDLVLLDIRMPRLSGEEVFARLHEMFPAVAHRFSYGLRDNRERGAGNAKGSLRFHLQKPFKRDDLLLVVGRAFTQVEVCRRK